MNRTLTETSGNNASLEKLFPENAFSYSSGKYKFDLKSPLKMNFIQFLVTRYLSVTDVNSLIFVKIIKYIEVLSMMTC